MSVLAASWKRGVIERLRPIARHLPEAIKRPLREWTRDVGRVSPAQGSRDAIGDAEYATRAAVEKTIFAGQTDVHDLPPIFHYWSNRWLRPEMERFGFSNPDQFIAQYLQRTCAELARPARFASFGSGNCDTEIRVAGLLVGSGVRDFVIECVDINEAMLERGRKLATEAGVAAHIETRLSDFNRWRPAHSYDAIVAHQSLHHVVELEDLFSAIDDALAPHGRFIAADIMGRNGHMRWPEAMAIIHEYWRELPRGYRWNVQMRRRETLLEYWDCSTEGFEGIRAQDILPLLVERFDFEFFFAFGNLIDPFIDRSFGPHFDAEAAWNRDFIDRVHARDEAELRAGTITPTHVLAVMRKRPYHGECRIRAGLAPEFCVRRPDA